MSKRNIVASVAPHIERNIVPAFVRQDHPAFVKLLVEFYNWATREGGAVKNVRDHLQFRDVDYIVNQFYDQASADLMQGLPATNQPINKAIVLQRIKDFYITRGSVASFEFMFRYLYNEGVSIEYPKDTILRTDTGSYISNSVVRTISQYPLQTYGSLQYAKAVGSVTGAVGSIDKIVFFEEDGVLYTEWTIVNIDGVFSYTENLIVDDPQDKTAVIIEPIIPSVLGINITDPGAGYSVGDSFSHTSDLFHLGMSVEEIDERGGIVSVVADYPSVVNKVSKLTNYALNTETFSRDTWSYPGTFDIVGSVKGRYGTNRPLCYVTKTAQDVLETIVTFPGKTSTNITLQFVVDPKAGSIRLESLDTGVTLSWIDAGGVASFQGTSDIIGDAECDVTSLVDGQFLIVLKIPNHTRFTDAFDITINSAPNTRWPIQGLMVTDTDTVEFYLPTKDSSVSGFKNFIVAGVGSSYPLFQPMIAAVVPIPGYYENNKGLLSSTNNLYDGEYYQEFSYVISTGASLAQYEQILTDTIHPAGMKMFGNVLLTGVGRFQDKSKLISNITVTRNESAKLSPMKVPDSNRKYTRLIPSRTVEIRMNRAEAQHSTIDTIIIPLPRRTPIFFNSPIIKGRTYTVYMPVLRHNVKVTPRRTKSMVKVTSTVPIAVTPRPTSAELRTRNIVQVKSRLASVTLTKTLITVGQKFPRLDTTSITSDTTKTTADSGGIGASLGKPVTIGRQTVDGTDTYSTLITTKRS